jgi:hypothetical protein
MGASKAQRALTADRRKRALNMRTAGIPWARIAEELHYADAAAACRDVDRALTLSLGAVTESASNLRALELIRLDRLQAGLWPSAIAGDTKAAKAVLDVHRARVKLLGLDAAQRTLDNAVDAWINGVVGDGDAADLAAAAAANAAADDDV